MADCESISNTATDDSGALSLFSAGTTSDSSALQAMIGCSSQGAAITAVSGNGCLGTTGIGVIAKTDQSNAILAINRRADLGAAVISANAPSDSGLAYWGSGSMELTGGLCVGASCSAVKGVGNFTAGLQVAGICRFGSCMTSDERLKKNIRPMTSSLDILTRLRPVTFEWKNPEEHGGKAGTQRGFIAQEVEKVMPEWVGLNDKGFRTLDMLGLEPMLVDSVRALKAQNDSLLERVQTLEAQAHSQRVGFAEKAWGFGGLGALGLGVAAMSLVGSRRRRDERE